tara:strand:- start:75 stop:476 length:402 start_codon:yes stop_codon:yes gene_type:complete
MILLLRLVQPMERQLTKTSETFFAHRYLKNFKKFLNSLMLSLSIEYPDKVKYESIKHLVYSGKADVLYIYVDDEFTSELIQKTLSQILNKDIEPCLKSISSDRINNMNVIELNYWEHTIINTNIKQQIDTLTI